MDEPREYAILKSDTRLLGKNTWDLVEPMRDQIDQFMRFAPQSSASKQVKYDMLGELNITTSDSTIAMILCMAQIWRPWTYAVRHV
jgi:hypothetical protein